MKKIIGVQVEMKTYDRLLHEARADNRTLSGQLRHIIAKHFRDTEGRKDEQLCNADEG